MQSGVEISEYFEIPSQSFIDERGSFLEWYKFSKIKALGIDFKPIQANVSSSRFGVIRGLHFSLTPNRTNKLLTCINGKIRDIGLDIRESSPTFGKWAGNSPRI